MRLVVTGREGQVVRALLERFSGGAIEVVALGRPQIDLSGPTEPVVAALKETMPDVIVSAAAYTQVDRAETEPDVAFAVNEQGARGVAQAARQLSVPLIHLSTDYVFDGAKASPYVEEDKLGPTGVYGASKLAGERAVLGQHGDCTILRIAWVYSPFGTNFVKTMLRLASDRDEIAVVSDQMGNPTSAIDIADGILAVATNLCSDCSPALRGIFHMTADGTASWAEFAEAIFSASAELGGPVATVKRIKSSEYPTAAVRPANSSLDSSKLARIHEVHLPNWHSSLNKVVAGVLQRAARGGGRR